MKYNIIINWISQIKMVGSYRCLLVICWCITMLWCFRTDSEMWLFGFKSGVLRTWLKKDGEWFSQKDYEDILLHDSDFEGVTDLCMSCDSRFVVASGSDANLFVYVVRLQPSPASEVQHTICEVVFVFFLGKLHTTFVLKLRLYVM